MDTARTLLRRPNLKDTDALLEMETDPEVFKYLPPGRPFTRDQVLERLQKQMDEENLHAPFGTWVAEDKDSGEFIAWFMLMKLRYDSHELGFVLRKKFWGQGYGSEIAKRIVDYGFKNGLAEILAVTSPENIASGSLLEKVGFSFKKMVTVEGEDISLKLFEIGRPS